MAPAEPVMKPTRGVRWGLSRITTMAPAEVSRRRADEQIAWLRDYAACRINPWLIDERRCIPPHIVQDFGAAGLFGPLIEEQYGGTALRFGDLFRVLEQLIAIDTALGTWVGTSVFPGTRALSVWAQDRVKQEWLPLLATGRTLGAYAQTEPGAGSDFSQLSTVARPVNGTWLLNGTKHLVGNGTWAGISTVFARAQKPSGRSSLIALAVPTASAGVRPGEEHLTLGQRGMVQSRMHFADVTVPDSAVLAGGDGRAVAMDSMSASRLGVGAAAIGALKRIVQLAERFTRRRQIGALPLQERAWVRRWLAMTVTRTDILEALVYDLADRLDAGQHVEMEPLIAVKVFGAEWSVEAADMLVQLMGGRGYDEANTAARMYRDLRVYRIFEGPSEALTDFLGRWTWHQPRRLHATISQRCGTDLADQFTAALQQVPARPGQGSDVFHDRVATAVMWIFTADAVRRRAAHHTEAHTMADDCLQRALQRLQADHPSAGISPDRLHDALRRYEQHVGDITPQLPGPHTTLDPLLHKAQQ